MNRQLLFVYSNDLILFVKKYKKLFTSNLMMNKIIENYNNETISINILTFGR